MNEAMLATEVRGLCCARGRSYVDGSLQARCSSAEQISAMACCGGAVPCFNASRLACVLATLVCMKIEAGMVDWSPTTDHPLQDFIKWENSELLRCDGRAFLLDYSEVWLTWGIHILAATLREWRV